MRLVGRRYRASSPLPFRRSPRKKPSPSRSRVRPRSSISCLSCWPSSSAIFEQAQVNVELQHFSAARARSNPWSAAAPTSSPARLRTPLRMQAKGQPMQSIVLFGRYPGNILGIAKASAATYKSPVDLKGQKIGITGPGSATQTFLNLILEKARLQARRRLAGDGRRGRRRGRGDEARQRALRHLQPRSRHHRADHVRAKSWWRSTAVRPRSTRAVYGGDYASGSLYAPAAFRAAQSEERRGDRAVDGAHARLDEEGDAGRDHRQAAWPTSTGPIRRSTARRWRANLASFSPDGLMPADAPANVLKAMTRFDPAIASAKIDMGTTYDNHFVEAARKAVK